MRERPPPAAAETDGAATDPARRIRSPRRRPARGSRPPHASRPRSTPARSSRQGNPGTPARRPRTTAATADSSEPYRSHRARNRIVVSTDGSVSSGRMPVVRLVSLHHRPALQGRPLLLESGREALARACPARGPPRCAARRASSSRSCTSSKRRASQFLGKRSRSSRAGASRVTGDAPARSTRRAGSAGEHPARSAPPYGGPPRRRQSRPKRTIHPSGLPPAVHSVAAASFLFFMTAGFAGAGR